MGRYINTDAVVDRYRELADIAETLEGSYILQAEYEIDGRLNNYFTTPFDTGNITVNDLVIDLVFVKYLRSRDKERSDNVKDAIDDTINMLKKGEMSMVMSGGAVIQSVGEVVYSNTKDYEPTFDMQNPLEWSVGSSQLQAEFDAKNF